MKPFLSLILLSLFLNSCSFKSQTEVPFAINQPAEFESKEAIWLIWPANDFKRGESVTQVMIDIIEAIGGDEKIVVTCRDTTLLNDARATLENHFGVLNHVTLIHLPSYDIWARDMGPVFVKTSSNKLAVADFNFNSWGYSDTLDEGAKIDELYDTKVAEHLKLSLLSSAMISEGGNREVNGKGTLMTTETVEAGRNPSMTKKAMEAEYSRLIGVKKVIWLKKGLVEDDHTFLGPILTADGAKAYTVVTTNGHVDEFARFVNDSTILLAQIDSVDPSNPIAVENHKRLEENYQILSKATDQDGKPFTIIRMPLAETIYATITPGDAVYDYIKTLEYKDGSIFPDGKPVKAIAALSYLNFIITNKTIIGQRCWRVGMSLHLKQQDEQAAKILQAVFPDRKIVMINALAVNLGGGGIHCISIQQPVL